MGRIFTPILTKTGHCAQDEQGNSQTKPLHRIAIMGVGTEPCRCPIGTQGARLSGIGQAQKDLTDVYTPGFDSDLRRQCLNPPGPAALAFNRTHDWRRRPLCNPGLEPPGPFSDRDIRQLCAVPGAGNPAPVYHQWGSLLWLEQGEHLVAGLAVPGAIIQQPLAIRYVAALYYNGLALDCPARQRPLLGFKGFPALLLGYFFLCASQLPESQPEQQRQEYERKGPDTPVRVPLKVSDMDLRLWYSVAN